VNGTTKLWQATTIEVMATVWAGALAFCAMVVCDVVVDGLFPVRVSMLISAFCGAAIVAALCSVGAALLLLPVWRLVLHASAQRQRLLWGLLLFVLLAANLTADPFLVVYYVMPDPPVQLWLVYLTAALPAAAVLAIVGAWRLARSWSPTRLSIGLSGASLVVVWYALGSIVPRDLHLGVSLFCAFGLLVSWYVTLASCFGAAGERRLRIASRIAVGTFALVLLGAIAQPQRFRDSLVARDVVVRGSELLNGAALVSHRLLGDQDDVLARLRLQRSAAMLRPAARAAAPRPSGPVPRGLIVITVDALRLDALNQRSLPTFARLRRESLELADYSASSPVTAESLHALFNGRTAGENACDHSLWSALHRAGMRTIAVPLPQVDSRCGWQRLGVDALVDVHQLRSEPNSAPQVLAALVAEVRRTPGRFFAWAHLLEPHLPYEAEGKTVKARYQGEVRKIDRALAVMLRQLEEAGVLNDTALVVAADHGEELGEHCGRSHSRTLYDEVLRVPFFLRYAGVPSGRQQGLFSEVDVMPTLLELMGAAPMQTLGQEGLSIFDPHAQAVRFARLGREQAFMSSVQVGTWKLIVNHRYASAELYDLSVDPGEFTNRVSTDPAMAAALAELLAQGPQAAASKMDPSLDTARTAAP
jgi:hypothetical protein